MRSVARVADVSINTVSKLLVDAGTPSKAPNRARGGERGGPARAAKLSPERRQEIARKAAKKRWK
jgi:hypothetical protein